jgi:hypothetical protein
MIYLFVVLIGGLGLIAYLSIMFNAVPGTIEERLGVLEALPENLGQWFDDASPEAEVLRAQGKRREVRYLLESAGLFRGQVLVKQARVRDVASNEILEVLPETRTRRRRQRV